MKPLPLLCLLLTLACPAGATAPIFAILDAGEYRGKRYVSCTGRPGAQRTSFWSQQMHGHIDSVGGKTTAVDIRPNVGRWKASAEDIVGPAAARSRGAQ